MCQFHSLRSAAAAFLAALALLLSFALLSCENGVKTPDTLSATPSDGTVDTADGKEALERPEPEDKKPLEESDYTDDLSDETFDGYDYRILVRLGQKGSQYIDEPKEDIVDDAIYRRNKAVEDRFHVRISAYESKNSDYETDALDSILAGDDAYDVIFTHSRAAFAYAVQGACRNVLDIRSLHLDKPWWSQNIIDSCTLNDRLYVLDGDISIDGLYMAMTLFFNKTVFDELGFDYPYGMVRDGTWTFDEFAYLVKKGGKDLNGDGVIQPEDDRYGLWTSVWSAPINVLYAGRQKVYDKDASGELQLTLYSSKTVQIFNSFFNLADNEAVFVSDETYTGSDPFPEGRAMFSAGLLGFAKGFRNMEDEFGILPYPKYDELDDYGTAINGYAPLMVIPLTVSDPERTGAITEALAAYGSMYVLPAFYDVSLKTKYARDTDSEEMMDIIHESIVFDIGYLSGGRYSSHGRELCSISGHDFSSWYAARESAAKSDLANFKADYGGIG